jgi:xylose dehydrogenase (NAD/NADP)
LLADDQVDAVYVSLPNSLHVDWATRALTAGRHVLCEKPLSRHAGEVAAVFDLAERSELLLMEAFMYRHHPQTRALTETVASGSIGELRQIHAAFCFLLDDPADVRLRPELDGGSLMDLGCYCLSSARLLAGEPESVFGRQVLGPTGVDVRFGAMLQFAGDVHAQFHCGFDLPDESRLEVLGSEGSVLVREPVRCLDPHLELWRGGDVVRIDVEDADRYQLQLENFAAAVRGEAEPLLGRGDAVGQARAIEALYRSASEGEAVSP